MNPKLKDSIAIYKELGWEKATPGNVLDLPLGTPEQQKTALEGLKTGRLGDFVDDGRYIQWKQRFKVSLDRLVLFAIRLGVTAARAKSILNSTWDRNFDDAKVKVITARGEKFATSLAASWYGNNTEGTFSNIPVRLVYDMNLDLPQSIGYFADWATFAYEALNISRNNHRWIDPEGKWLTPSRITPRFEEHILAGLAVNVPLTHNFGHVALHGVEHGMVNRDTILPHIFTALDAAIRPADRKTLLQILDKLNITDQELTHRTQALIPLLATSDTTVINRLAPPLIANASEDLLTEIMLSAFSATTKKTRLLVLKAATNRPAPPNADEIAPWLSMLAADKDKAISTAATKLIKAWDIQDQQPQEEETEIQNLWQDTPPVWQVPNFDPGEITQDHLTTCIAEIFGRQGETTVHDIEVERLLTIAVALAYKNKEEVRLSLAGLKTSEWWGAPLLHYLSMWSKGENMLKPGWSSRNPLVYRDRFVVMNLGQIPCLLSSPSKVDLTITVPDLAERLAHYQKLNISVLDSDLFIALTRLDIDTKTPEAIALLQSTTVNVQKPNQGLMRRVMTPVNAAEMALKYIDDPTAENPQANKGKIPKSLALFNCHVPDSGIYGMFPLWGDVALKCIDWCGGYHNHAKGHILRQAARRRDPLPPGAAINRLGAQRSSSPQSQEDAALAVSEAWERGLLRPGTPDIALLDWREKGPPANLAALAVVLESLARDGMLSLVWPILDALVQESLAQPRLLSGTAELAETMAELLPEVQHAVNTGKADSTALHLPGICELASKSGTSKAVAAAKKIAAQLPEGQRIQIAESSKTQKPAPEMKIPFDKVWPKPDPDVTIIEDGAEVSISAQAENKEFIFSIKLPGNDGAYNIVNISTYNLEHDGLCSGRIFDNTTSTARYDSPIFLYWDSTQQAIAVSYEWNDAQKAIASLGMGKKSRGKKPRLSISIITMVLASLAADSTASYDYYYSKELINALAKKEGLLKKDGQINPPVIKRAMEIILQSPAVSPAKISRIIEKELHLLPALWPVLSQSIKHAGAKVAAGEKAPHWLNRILDVTLQYAPYLAEAAKRGYIPAEDASWPGLSDIANAKTKSVSVAKAASLCNLV